jgi:hypothetical protein
LTLHGLDYKSIPTAFLAVTPTILTRDVLQMAETRPIFGRRTELHIGGHKRGDIIEALPLYDRQRAFA